MSTLAIARAPGAAQRPTAAAQPNLPRLPRARAAAGLLAILTTAILGQRLAVPVAGTPLSVVLFVTYAVLGYLLVVGALRESRGRALGYVIATAACAVATTGWFLYHPNRGPESFLLLVLVYLPFCVRLRSELRDLYPLVLTFFTRLMAVLAAVGVGQVLAQFIGVWSYRDYLGEAVPSQFLIPGYNTSSPLQYGSPVMKANAFVFLEPSFFSQFIALALIVTLVRRGHVGLIALYAVALACTVSGTGLLLLAAGLAALAFSRGFLWTCRMAAIAVLALVAVSATPMGPIFTDRAGEFRYEESSGSLRFVQPYQYVAKELAHDPATLLLGTGPGGADAAADDVFEETDKPISFSTVPKLLLEYGLVAGLLFTAFVVMAFLRRVPSITIALSALFLHLVLSGSLLQPQTVYVCLLLTGFFAAERRDQLPTASPSGPNLAR